MIQKRMEEESTPYEKQLVQIENLKQSMTEYMGIAHPSYTKNDIEACEYILTEFIKHIDKTTAKVDGMQVVESTIIKLNKLNKKCNSQLFETGEREQIAEIIIGAGNQKGYNALDEDITEQWREW